ncbi:hypothetical protein ACFVFI_11075 [Streptomyces sp. NPDC057705]|uniref:hypothetical protein n=1 Tax=Streptomyces sp. NPDC057705 TaxID=3346222 RepID=UPI003686BF53
MHDRRHLFLAVARALVRGELWALASRFVRIAGPRALTEGRGQLALQLYALGRMAAARGGLTKDVKFYDRAEKLTRDLLDGDKAGTAAAAAVPLAPALGAAAVESGKALGFFGKIVATVSTKTGARLRGCRCRGPGGDHGGRGGPCERHACGLRAGVRGAGHVRRRWQVAYV